MTCTNIDLPVLAFRWRCWQTQPDLQVYEHPRWRSANGLDATGAFPALTAAEASRGTLASVQVIPRLPTKRHHSPVRSKLSVGAGRESILPFAQKGQCHRGANVQRAGQAGFAHISHVPRYDLIRDMSIGPSKRTLAAASPQRLHSRRSFRVRQRSANIRGTHLILVFVQVGAKSRHPGANASATVVPTYNAQVSPGSPTYPTFPGMTL